MGILYVLILDAILCISTRDKGLFALKFDIVSRSVILKADWSIVYSISGENT